MCISTDSVLLLTNLPTPYRIPLFNVLSNKLKIKGISLIVVFGALGEDRRQWKINLKDCHFKYHVMSGDNVKQLKNESLSFSYKGLFKIINEYSPKIIITNGFSIATVKLWLRSFYNKTPYVIWSGAINSKYRKISYLKYIQRRLMIQKAKGFIAYGSESKKYLVSLGANEDLIEIAINTVDISFFENKQVLEKKEPTRFIYVGNLTKGKRVDLLISASKELSNIYPSFYLDIIGDGPEKQSLIAMSKELNMSEKVLFHGFKQKEYLPDFLSKASCFLFPSEYDVWGLVLVEAMAMELPCIASTLSGATHDLIQDNITGFKVNFKDTPSVVDKMSWIIKNPEKARLIGTQAKTFISENVNLNKSSLGFLNIIDKLI